MKLFLYFFLFLFLNCQSQDKGNKPVSSKKEISFEDKYHYPFSLTQKDFFIIDSQEKMDEIFKIIHQNNQGNRFSPIPAIVEGETYIIIKPQLKNTNDVLIDNISLSKNTLYVKVKEFNNPDVEKSNRNAPNILLKLLEPTIIKKTIIQY